MSKRQDWRQKELQRLRLYQPLELAILRRTYPMLDVLLQQLWDLHEAADPRKARPIGLSRGSGEKDGTETRGSEDGPYGRVAMRGGFDTEGPRERIHEVNHDLRRLAERIFDGLDVPRVARPVLGKTRQCRQDGCPDKGRRQYGMMVDGRYRCRSCNHSLGDG